MKRFLVMIVCLCWFAFSLCSAQDVTNPYSWRGKLDGVHCKKAPLNAGYIEPNYSLGDDEWTKLTVSPGGLIAVFDGPPDYRAELRLLSVSASTFDTQAFFGWFCKKKVGYVTKSVSEIYLNVGGVHRGRTLLVGPAVTYPATENPVLLVHFAEDKSDGNVILYVRLHTPGDKLPVFHDN